MHKVLSVVGVSAAVVLILASASMNYLFAASLGRSWHEGQVLGIVSVAVDVLKALLAMFVARAAIDGRKTFVAVGGSAFVLFTIASAIAAAGFVSVNRNTVVKSAKAQSAHVGVIEREVEILRKRLAALPDHRPMSLVTEAINGWQLDRNWSASRACKSATSDSSRLYCDKYFRLKGELETGREAERLERQIERQMSNLDASRSQETGMSADPQAVFFAQTFGTDEGTVQRFLMGLIALVVEVGSGLGIYLATGSQPMGLTTSHSNAVEPAINTQESAQVIVSAPMPAQGRGRRRTNGFPISDKAPLATIYDNTAK